MDGGTLLGKADLCSKLGWSRPRLDRVLERDSNFPVHTRGTAAGGWEFDLPMVTQYLAAGGGKLKGGRKPRTVEQERAEANTAASAPPTAPAQHQGEVTEKQRKDHWAANLVEDRVRRERGELLEVDDVRMTWGAAFAGFSRHLDALPEQLVKRLGLEEADAERVREVTGELRATLVKDLTGVLAPAQ